MMHAQVASSLGAVHKRRRQLRGGKGLKIGQNCQRIVLKTADMEEGVSKIQKNCQHCLWMAPTSDCL